MKQIPVLSIHDSFIVTRQNEEHLEEAMERAVHELTQSVLRITVTSKSKRSVDLILLMRWRRLKTFEFEREGTPEKISNYWEEQREWVRGLEDGKFPEYARRLKLHRSIGWSSDYFMA